MNLQQWFAGRTCVVATMHHKETVIEPLLFAALGVRIQVPAGFDTDQFGTFTRDRERPGNQLETARKKARAALDLTGETLGIASEGSFFPHPALPMVPCNREIVLLEDRVHDFTFWGESLSLETNFHSEEVRNWQEVIAFAQKVGFPDHGLVVMPSSQAQAGIHKGIRDWDALAAAVEETWSRSPSGTIHVETDMRALHNPTRLRNIAQATEDLLRKLKTPCPACAMPGFALVENLPGLPCSWCGMPTTLVRAAISRCPFCEFTEAHPYPGGCQTADPSHCTFCNP